MEATIKSQVNDILLPAIDQKQEIGFMQNKEYFLNKDDKVELVEKIGDVKTDLTEKIGNVKTELITKISNLKSELNTSIYIVGLVQVIIIITSLIGIVNFMLK